MILSIILFILIVLLVAILIMFLFYMLFPSVKQQMKINDDPILLVNEIESQKKQNENDSGLGNKPASKRMKAFVLCSCNKKSFSTKDVHFNENFTCSMVNSVYGTGTDCKFSCIGLGDCMKVCPQNAIVIENRTAVITDLCTGCGKCIGKCPLNIISLLPAGNCESVKCKYSSGSYAGTTENVTCSEKENMINCHWNDKKDFKIWKYCYKMYRKLRK